MFSMIISQTKDLNISVNSTNNVEIISTDMNLDLRRNVDYLIRESEQKFPNFPGTSGRARYIKEELDKNYPGITFTCFIYIESKGDFSLNFSEGYNYQGKYKGYRYSIFGKK